MLRRLHLILAALVMLVAPVAMQAGVVMAAMPMDHREMAQSGHCGDEDPGRDEKSSAANECCVAMCSAVAPLSAASLEPSPYHVPLLFALPRTEHRAFVSKLPTPPPRRA